MAFVRNSVVARIIRSHIVEGRHSVVAGTVGGTQVRKQQKLFMLDLAPLWSEPEGYIFPSSLKYCYFTRPNNSCCQSEAYLTIEPTSDRHSISFTIGIRCMERPGQTKNTLHAARTPTPIGILAPEPTSCQPSNVVTVNSVSRDHKRLSKLTMPE